MAILHLRWGDPDRREHVYNLVRHRHPLGHGFEAHDHDYAEVMWVEIGTYSHHLNGITEELGPGDLRCIRPQDAHSCQAHEGGGVLVNLAFPLSGLGHLARRHRAIWPWSPERSGGGVRMSPDFLERMQQWCHELSWPGAGSADLECCLLDLTRLLARPTQVTDRQPFPPWLRQGLQLFQADEHLAGGVPRLAELCDCSVAHLNRTVQAVKGCTTSELVANLRLDWVATALRQTSLPAAELIERTGISNRSYFYRLFVHRYGVTPLHYRKALSGSRPSGVEGGATVLG